MQSDVERLVEAVVLLEVRPLGRPGHEDEVTRRRDGQELGQPLNEPEDERLAVRHRVGVVPHSEEREDDGETERGSRDAEHDGAAHGEILRSSPLTRVGNKRGANCGNPVKARLTRLAMSHRFPLAPSTERK